MSAIETGKIRVVEIPVGGPPHEAWYNKKGLAKEIMTTVGGVFDEIDVFGNDVTLCEHEEAQLVHEANRAIYMNEHMVEDGYYSQMDYETVPPVGGLYMITYGPLVLVAMDWEEEEAVSMTDEQVAWALETFADETSGVRELDAYTTRMLLGGAYRIAKEK